MSTATLTSAAPDVARAATDRAYYDTQVDRLTGRDLTQFERNVTQAYALAHTPRALTGREQRIIAFAAQRFRHPGAREQAIRDRFEMSATRYYQQLNQLLDRPEALKAYPGIIGPLRRQRDQRRTQRTTRPAGSTR